MERIQKIIANSGIMSRRKAEEALIQGRVELNGRVVTSLGTKALVADEIRVDGESVSKKRKRTTLAFHKPAEVICTKKDPFGRTCIRDFLPAKHQDLYPVTRLDYRSEGLVILTNDGELAQKWMDRSHEWVRTYRVRVKGQVQEASIRRLQAKCHLEEGTFQLKSVKVMREAPKGKTDIEIETTDSYPDLIQRICYRAGHPVIQLRCVGAGPIALGSLPRGGARIVPEGILLQIQEASAVKKKKPKRRH